MQKKKGISLIVLVITIIVMIILAAAIILSLNNAGIIGNANKAVDESNMANVKTAADLAYAEYLIDKPVVDNLENYLTEKLVQNGTIEGKGKDYYIKIIDGETTVIKEGSTADKYFDGDIKIGYYVNYDPTKGVDNPDTLQYTSPKAKNGFGNQEFNMSSYDNTNYKWQVMGIGKNGSLLLISEGQIETVNETGLVINGINCFVLSAVKSEGINNKREVYLSAIGELNNICSIFGKGYGAIGARSVNLNDVNKITGYNPEKVEDKFREGEVGEYGNEVTYYWYNDGTDIKVYYDGTKNNATGYLTKSHLVFEWYEDNKYFSQARPKGLAVGEKQKITTIKSDYYYYYPTTYTTSSSGEIKGEITPDKLEYNVLFSDSNSTRYWLATTGRYAVYKAHNESESLGFAMNGVLKGHVTGSYLFNSDGTAGDTSRAIRAVVILDPNVVLEQVGTKTVGTNTAKIYDIK